MDLTLGKKASKYYDRGVVEREIKKNRQEDLFDMVRKVWLFIGGALNKLVINIELEFLKKVSITAWKLHLLSKVDKLQ